MADGPPWLRAILRVERAVAGPLERATNSSEGADGLLIVARGARIIRRLGDGARHAIVHAFDLPTHRDVQLLDAKVERLHRALDDWSAGEHDRREMP
jgi:hypothetical protein